MLIYYSNLKRWEFYNSRDKEDSLNGTGRKILHALTLTLLLSCKWFYISFLTKKIHCLVIASELLEEELQRMWLRCADFLESLLDCNMSHMQRGHKDCGLFAMTYASCRAQRKELSFTHAYMKFWRSEIDADLHSLLRVLNEV